MPANPAMSDDTAIMARPRSMKRFAPKRSDSIPAGMSMKRRARPNPEMSRPASANGTPKLSA